MKISSGSLGLYQNQTTQQLCLSTWSLTWLRNISDNMLNPDQSFHVGLVKHPRCRFFCVFILCHALILCWAPCLCYTVFIVCFILFDLTWFFVFRPCKSMPCAGFSLFWRIIFCVYLDKCVMYVGLWQNKISALSSTMTLSPGKKNSCCTQCLFSFSTRHLCQWCIRGD